MHKWLVVALAAGASASAQTLPNAPEQDREARLVRQQWRLELRADVSSASRRSEFEGLQLAPPQTSRVGVQMSSQARAELREQLRQFQVAPAVRHRP